MTYCDLLLHVSSFLGGEFLGGGRWLRSFLGWLLVRLAVLRLNARHHEDFLVSSTILTLKKTTRDVFNINVGDLCVILLPGMPTPRAVRVGDGDEDVIVYPALSPRPSETEVDAVVVPVAKHIPAIPSLVLHQVSPSPGSSDHANYFHSSLSYDSEPLLRSMFENEEVLCQWGDVLSSRCSDYYQPALTDSSINFKFLIGAGSSPRVFTVDPKQTKLTLVIGGQGKTGQRLENVLTTPPSVPRSRLRSILIKSFECRTVSRGSRPRILLTRSVGEWIHLTDLLVTEASSEGLTVVSRSGTALSSETSGSIEGKLKQFFAIARKQAPCVALVIGIHRWKRGHENVGRRVSSALEKLVLECEKDDVVFAATCASFEELDPAVAQLFTIRLEVGLPDKGERRRILGPQSSDQTVDMTVGFSEKQLEHLKVLKTISSRRNSKVGFEFVIV
jgi:hypothetical protein